MASHDPNRRPTSQDVRTLGGPGRGKKNPSRGNLHGGRGVGQVGDELYEEDMHADRAKLSEEHVDRAKYTEEHDDRAMISEEHADRANVQSDPDLQNTSHKSPKTQFPAFRSPKARRPVQRSPIQTRRKVQDTQPNKLQEGGHGLIQLEITTLPPQGLSDDPTIGTLHVQRNSPQFALTKPIEIPARFQTSLTPPVPNIARSLQNPDSSIINNYGRLYDSSQSNTIIQPHTPPTEHGTPSNSPIILSTNAPNIVTSPAQEAHGTAPRVIERANVGTPIQQQNLNIITQPSNQPAAIAQGGHTPTPSVHNAAPPPVSVSNPLVIQSPLAPTGQVSNISMHAPVQQTVPNPTPLLQNLNPQSHAQHSHHSHHSRHSHKHSTLNISVHSPRGSIVPPSSTFPSASNTHSKTSTMLKENLKHMQEMMQKMDEREERARKHQEQRDERARKEQERRDERTRRQQEELTKELIAQLKGIPRDDKITLLDENPTPISPTPKISRSTKPSHHKLSSKPSSPKISPSTRAKPSARHSCETCKQQQERADFILASKLQDREQGVASKSNDSAILSPQPTRSYFDRKCEEMKKPNEERLR